MSLPDPKNESWPRRFLLRPDTTATELHDLLKADFQIKQGAPKKETLALYDTHVWTLWFENLVLIKSRTNLLLFTREGEWPVGQALASIPLRGKCPRFLRNFPASNLRDRLESEVEHRALDEVASVQSTVSEWNLRNKSAKTLVRLYVRETLQTASRTLVELIPLRGYEEEANAVSDLLTGIADISAVSPLGEALRATGATPTPYVLKPELHISADQETRTVVCEAAAKTLEVARANELGIIEDWDSEFLHDYRVSLRRIRSVLSSIKGIFPEETLADWKTQLGTIARHTNKLRDLDVYLLSQDDMTQLLPEVLQPHLAGLFTDLSKERKQEQQKLKAYLKSSGYQSSITALAEAFSHPESLAETKHSRAPIKEQAAKRVLKRFHKLTDLAEALSKDSPDEDIHSIRIAGKKLRYLLEFFGSLFPEEEMENLTDLLSKLQSRLGDFNDTSVQQAYLLNYAKTKSHDLSPRLAMSLGGLVTALDQEHGVLRREVLRALKVFCTEIDVSEIESWG